ncbi:MAG TPA: MBL fold metallo-hydrolase [Luteibaculaceae bacterium]|nr:MBL fold metallo-hydrolase [Luteibaculaceae bacterium]
MNLYTIDTGRFKLDGGAMFGVVPKTLWSRNYPADDNNLCTWAMRCLLVENGNRLILIDTGIGNKQSDKFFGHYHLHQMKTLESCLHEKGFSSDQITDVFLTHLHFDHCGGAVYRDAASGLLVPTFKNATYWSNEAHWNWAIQPNAREKASFLSENILPIQESGQLKFIQTQDWITTEVLPGIDVITVNGHTEAQMLPVINKNGRKIVFCADLLPSPHHIPLAWIMGYDMRPLVTLTEKERFLKEAAANEYVLMYEHDAKVEAGLVVATDRGIAAGETVRLTDL